MATLLTLLASACKRNQTNEPAAAAEGEAAAPQEQAAVVEEHTAAGADDQTATGSERTASGRSIDALPVPADWLKVSAQTPKRVKVSFAVPSEWVHVPPPNESTLLVRGAPYKIAAGGTKVTLVAVEFVGGRTELADYTRQRLSGLAVARSEGPLRVGTMNGYEFVVHWSGPSGDKDTVQLLLATGDEAIAVTCELHSEQFETLRGLCDEIFATVSVEGATPKE
jgi:hypothetical protein